MLFVSFGRWNHAAGTFFIRERIWLRGYIWTPFVRVRRRYQEMFFARTLAWLLPKKVVYWAALRLIAYATQGEYGNTIPELTAMDALKRFEAGIEGESHG